MIDLAPFVSAGTGIWWGQAGAEPEPLVHALLDQAAEHGPVRAFCGVSWNDRLASALPDEVHLSSYGGLGVLRLLSKTGQLDVVPCHYSALPRLFAEGHLPADVGFVQVSPPDADGRCSVGIGVDYVADAIEHTPVLIAEINERMPATRGAPRIPLSRFDAVVHTSRPLPTAPERATDEVDRVIGRHVAGLIEDGDTLQLGIGSLPSAVCDALTGHSDLGVHSGMISDGVIQLIDKGVVTGARKEIDTGVIVTGIALGSASLYARLPELLVEFRPASYTHSAATLSAFGSLVAINSALEVDLTGQVGAEVADGLHIGAVGGQADFSRAASQTGRGSIIALRATAGERSTIVSSLRNATVSTARSDVDAVVTEFGVAHLRGCGLAERMRRMTAIAAPQHREDLVRLIEENRG